MLQKIRDLIKSDKGFTLIELVVVIVILGILAAIAIPRFTSRRGEAEEAAIDADIKILQNAVDMYYVDKGAYPADLDALVSDYLKVVPESADKKGSDDTITYSNGSVDKIYTP